MARYTVEIEETLSRQVVVYAESEQEAIAKVEEQYDKSEIVLDASDFVDKTFEVTDVTD